MSNKEKAEIIDKFLEGLRDTSFPSSLALILELSQIPKRENKEKYKIIEYELERLGLVEFIRGRDNSTLGGQCFYFISGKGLDLISKGKSSIELFNDELIETIKMENEMDWHKVIFIAHASEDKPFVRKLYKKLKDSGLEPWLDEESLMPGVKWDDKIKEAIKNARFFLACISTNSIEKSGYIQRELRMALNELEQKAPDVIYFIPALIEEVPLPNITVGTINLRDYQAANISNETGLARLISHLQKQVNIIEEIGKKEKPEFSSVRNALMHGEIDKAINTLAEYVSGNREGFANNVILLSSRYKRLIQSESNGIISRQDYEIQNNQIVYSLLETLKLIEADIK